MKFRLLFLLPLAGILIGLTVAAQAESAADAVRVGIIINPYAGDRKGPEQDEDATWPADDWQTWPAPTKRSAYSTWVCKTTAAH